MRVGEQKVCSPPESILIQYWLWPMRIGSYYELMHYKPWSDEECSNLLPKGKQSKLQQLQNKAT